MVARQAFRNAGENESDARYFLWLGLERFVGAPPVVAHPRDPDAVDSAAIVRIQPNHRRLIWTYTPPWNACRSAAPRQRRLAGANS